MLEPPYTICAQNDAVKQVNYTTFKFSFLFIYYIEYYQYDVYIIILYNYCKLLKCGEKVHPHGEKVHPLGEKVHPLGEKVHPIVNV